MSASVGNIHSDELFEAILPLLDEGLDASFIVRGMSMWPLLCDRRDTVILSSAEGKTIRRGDIVLLKIPGINKYLVHRVTKIYPDQSVVTTGDANCFRDGRFPASYIKAVSYRVIRKGREIECRSFRWKCLISIWMFLYPVRKPLLRGLIRLSRMHAGMK